MAYEPLNWKKNTWDLDCCQKDLHSRTLLRRQNATKKTHIHTPIALHNISKLNLGISGHVVSQSPWSPPPKRPPDDVPHDKWHNQNLSKVFKRPVKSYKIESSKETTSFLLFTPRLAWIVPKFNTTSKRARTGGASHIEKFQKEQHGKRLQS